MQNAPVVTHDLLNRIGYCMHYDLYNSYKVIPHDIVYAIIYTSSDLVKLYYVSNMLTAKQYEKCEARTQLARK